MSTEMKIAVIVAALICVAVGVVAIRKHVSFKWWIYREAIRKSRKREWEAYVDYYNGNDGPEHWERLLHITELLRRRRDLERWNQWVPEDRILGARHVVSQQVEVVSTEECAKTEAEIAMDIKHWLKVNTREETPRSVILELLNDYAKIMDGRARDA